MSITAVELIFNDAPSKINKDLTEFLSRNLEQIVLKGQTKIIFKIAEPGDIEKLRKREISRLPAMVIPTSKIPIMGIQDITEYFRQKVKNSRSMAPPKTEEEVLSAYMQAQMKTDKDSDGKLVIPSDQEEMDNFDLKSISMREVDRRQKELSNYEGTRISNKHSTGPSRQPTNSDVPNARKDNVEPGNPMTILNNMNSGNAENSKDDDLLRTLMQRIGDSSNDF